MLRARAYGPEPDIAGDPVALARLAELEAQARPAVVDSDEVPEAPVEVAEGVDDDAAVEPSDVPAVAPSGDETLRRPRMTLRTKAVWAASIVASVLVGAALASAFSAATSVSRGTPGTQVAILRADEDAVMPRFLREQFDEVTLFEEFEGIAVVKSNSGWIGNGGECMFLLFAAEIDIDSEFFSGTTYPGCGAGGFAATIQLVIDETMPEELRERFPEGSAVQFVLDGDKVGVFSDPG